MRTMGSSGYHCNRHSVATHGLRQTIHGYMLLVPTNQRVPKKLIKECYITSHK